ncbi:MAG: beta-carotene 15,15''-monooxygenase, Brp/Blh family, partial [Haloquadratum sp. J07HQX50]
LALSLSPLLRAAPPRARYLPFGISVILLGLPHGAVDHLVPARIRDVSISITSIGFVGIVYFFVGGIYLLWWLMHPSSAAIFFITLTLFHWGQGDLYAILTFMSAEHLPSRSERMLSLCVRGSLPMLVPLIFHPDAYQRVLTSFVDIFTREVDLSGVFNSITLLSVTGLVATLTITVVFAGAYRVSQGAAIRPFVIDIAELGLLWAFFAVVQPVFAVGVYFCVWHALRHIARLALIDNQSRTSLIDGKISLSIQRFARDAAPLTAVTLLLFVFFFWLLPQSPANIEAYGAVYLVGISVLTAPHVIVVSWMDFQQNVWGN